MNWSLRDEYTGFHRNPALPTPSGQPARLFQYMEQQGTFPWEQGGYSFWSCPHYIQTCWNARGRPNALFVHFNDPLNDLDGEICNVVSLLGITCPEHALSAKVNLVTFRSMKRDA